MNQALITNVDNKNVYLVRDNNISFYICVPSSNKVSIVLNLVDNSNLINMNNANMTDLTNCINDIYSKFHFNDVAVVTPVIDNNVFEQVKLGSEQAFLYLDKVMGYLINTSYKYLTGNNIGVDEKIKFNNNTNYSKFNEYFVNRYKDRVLLVNYNEAPVNAFENKSVNSSGSDMVANNVLENTSVIDTIDTSVNSSGNIKEPGFVSYVLLGVLVAVATLVLLYVII